jgi:hypothetical protein
VRAAGLHAALSDGMECAAHFRTELHGIELSLGRLRTAQPFPTFVVMRRVWAARARMHTELRTHPVGCAFCDVAQRQAAWLEWKGGNGSLRHETTALATSAKRKGTKAIGREQPNH